MSDKLSGMPRVRFVIEALLPFADIAGDAIHAEHNIIYMAGPTPDAMPSDVLAAIEAQGAFWDRDTESWAVFT
jgi:hypothetical protein